MIVQIKTNVGHSEAASGLSAVIKAVLAFEKNKIPPTYGVKKLNPKRKFCLFLFHYIWSLSSPFPSDCILWCQIQAQPTGELAD